MHTVSNVLDALRVKCGSDAAAALAIGLSRQQFHLARQRQRLNDDAATLAAALIGADAAYLLACLHFESAGSEESKRAWLDAARRLRPPVSDATPNGSDEPPPEAPDPDASQETRGSDDDAGMHIMRNYAGNKKAYNGQMQTHFDTSQDRQLAIDIIKWCLCVPKLPPDSPRLKWYVTYWNVPGKIAAARAAGTFDDRVADCPMFSAHHIPAALAALNEWRKVHTKESAEIVPRRDAA